MKERPHLERKYLVQLDHVAPLVFSLSKGLLGLVELDDHFLDSCAVPSVGSPLACGRPAWLIEHVPLFPLFQCRLSGVQQSLDVLASAIGFQSWTKFERLCCP